MGVSTVQQGSFFRRSRRWVQQSQSGQQMVEYSVMTYAIALAGIGPVAAVTPLFMNAMESYLVDILWSIALASP